MSGQAPIQRLAVIGVGLIGGSLALALKEAGAVEEVVGCGRELDNLEQAIELGVIDRYEQNAADAVENADMVFSAVPLGAMKAVFAEIAEAMSPDAVLTDGGSAKGSVLEAVKSTYGKVPRHFVGGHPIAGSERSGAQAAFATLYQDRRVILTPTEETDPKALARVRWMWEQTGAELVEMSVGHHDWVLAATSHLPHMLAYTLVDTLAKTEQEEEIFRYAAGGFRDFTRIASSDPTMWHDICVANRDALLAHMEHMIGDLKALQTAIEAGDSDYMRGVFERAKRERDAFCG